MGVGGVIVRQKRTAKRGRLIPLLAACGIGYVIGAWHVTALRGAGPGSAADTVALRFPQEWSAAPPAVTFAEMRSLRADTELFSPVPMLAAAQPDALQVAASPAAPANENSGTAASERRLLQTAAVESLDQPLPIASESPARAAPRVVAKGSAAATRPVAPKRPGYMLDDAQIAGIKQRLHLTADQERMWPAVEAALRNMAYKRTQQVAAARSTGRNVQTAAVDPEAVQGLQSAAVPLIMSFSPEQKEEVRSLAHVMGLDQLAAQF